MSTPLPAVPGVIKMAVNQILGDDLHVENILHYRYGTGGAPLTAAQLQVMCDQARAHWVAGIIPLQSNRVSFQSIQCTDLETPTSLEGVSAGAPVVGGTATAPMPAATALCISRRSATRSRSARGRIYLCGVTEANLFDAQHFTAALVSNFTIAIDGFDSLLAADTIPLHPVIVSYYSGTDATIPGRKPKPIRRTTPATFPVTSTDGVTRVATQRRRGR